MPRHVRQLRAREVGNTYVGAEDRFVVSLVVGYGEADGVKSKEHAAAGALELTRDGGQLGTHWYVYDRGTKEMTLVEQGDIGDLAEFEEDAPAR